MKTGLYKKAVNRAARFFMAAVPLYIFILFLGVKESGDAAGIYALLFKNILTLLAFSFVYGGSFLLFDAGASLPSTAKRLLHAFILYLASLAAAFIMGNSGRDVRENIIFVFIATLLFAVLYTAMTLIAAAVRKAIKR